MKREAHQVFVTALFVQETNCPAGFWHEPSEATKLVGASAGDGKVQECFPGDHFLKTTSCHQLE